MIKSHFIILIFLFVFSFISCGDIDEFEPGNSQTIIIAANTFTPNSLTVSPGETVFFYNEDGTDQRILSESAEDAFDDSGDFSSLVITPNHFGSITVPDTAIAGDTFFFYSEYFEDTMVTPNGRFDVE